MNITVQIDDGTYALHVPTHVVLPTDINDCFKTLLDEAFWWNADGLPLPDESLRLYVLAAVAVDHGAWQFLREYLFDELEPHQQRFVERMLMEEAQ